MLIELNLLPWREQLRNSQRQRFYSYVMASCIIGWLGMLSWHHHLCLHYQTLKYNLSVLQQTISTKPDPLLNELALNNQRTHHWLTLLSALPRTLPADCTLQQLSFGSKQLTFTGFAPNSASILNLSQQLSRSLNLANPDLQLQPTPSNYQFTLHFMEPSA